MASKVVQADVEDAQQIIEQEKLIFIFSTLISSGIPEEILTPCFPEENQDLTVEQKIELRKICEKWSISVIGDIDGSVRIFLNRKELIAKLDKPLISLRKDNSVLERHKQLYNEIHFSWWSLVEEKND